MAEVALQWADGDIFERDEDMPDRTAREDLREAIHRELEMHRELDLMVRDRLSEGGRAMTSWVPIVLSLGAVVVSVVLAYAALEKRIALVEEGIKRIERAVYQIQ